MTQLKCHDCSKLEIMKGNKTSGRKTCWQGRLQLKRIFKCVRHRKNDKANVCQKKAVMNNAKNQEETLSN